MASKVNWPEAIRPLLKKYSKTRHPLEYGNNYELLVMVVLSARDSDRNINQAAPALFAAYPDMHALSKASPADLHPYVRKVRGFGNKANWLSEIAKTIKSNTDIPLTLDGLTKLPGIGRKSANVILREAGKPPEGVIVDLHVVRVAPRLGIAKGTDPKKIEEAIMDVLPQKQWDAGMAMSFLGREICRPKPICGICLMRPVCEYYNKVIKKHPELAAPADKDTKKETKTTSAKAAKNEKTAATAKRGAKVAATNLSKKAVKKKK